MAIRISQKNYIKEETSKIGKLLYRKTRTKRTCPVVVQEWSGAQDLEDGLLQREQMTLKAKTRIQMDMGNMVKRGESGNKTWNMDQGQINKWRESRYTDTKGAWVTQHRGKSGCEINNSIINPIVKTQTQTDVVIVEKQGWN